ncbi:MAG: HlyD family type I secretion periplasmic adaptor subunit [Pseudomonadota bacterium]
MEPTNQPPVASRRKDGARTEVDFLPDADAIERSALPRYLSITVHILGGALLTFVLWASLSKVEKIVIAHGRLVNPTSNIVVQPLETSIIQKIEVRPGQVVRKGELLATLDPTFTQADDAQLRTRLRSLDTQIEGLRAELKGRSGGAALAIGARPDADGLLQSQLSTERQAAFQSQVTKMDQNLARLKASLETNRRDQQVLAQRVKSLTELETMQQNLLAENYGAKLHVLEARDRRLGVERELLMAHNKEQEQMSELASAQADRAAFGNSWRQKMMEDLLGATRERDGVNEQLQKADKRHQLVQLRAPADAVVLDVAKLSQGSVVKEAEQLFTLVPLGAQLEAEVQIDSLDIGYIKPGAPVHIKLDAFSFQQHGALDGKVRTISEDAFRRDAANAGQGMDAYYVSRIGYGDARLRKMAPQSRLLPGMTLTAEIVVGKRTVISYLLWPLTKALDESIREP